MAAFTSKLKSLFTGASSSPRKPRLGLEALETRDLLTAGVTATLTNGVLRIVGTEGNDTIRVRLINENLSVQGIPIYINGRANVDIDATAWGVRRIDVFGLGGNDEIRLNSERIGGNRPLMIPSFVDGGAGNDLIIGGASRDVLFGGPGDDSIVGRQGNDVLSGGTGVDALDGGDGNDTMINEDGRDALDGGGGENNFLNSNLVSKTLAAGNSLYVRRVNGNLERYDPEVATPVYVTNAVVNIASARETLYVLFADGGGLDRYDAAGNAVAGPTLPGPVAEMVQAGDYVYVRTLDTAKSLTRLDRLGTPVVRTNAVVDVAAAGESLYILFADGSGLGRYDGAGNAVAGPGLLGPVAEMVQAGDYVYVRTKDAAASLGRLDRLGNHTYRTNAVTDIAAAGESLYILFADGSGLGRYDGAGNAVGVTGLPGPVAEIAQASDYAYVRTLDAARSLGQLDRLGQYGYRTNAVSDNAAAGESLYVLFTDGGLGRWTGTGWVALPELGGRTVKGIALTGQVVYALTHAGHVQQYGGQGYLNTVEALFPSVQIAQADGVAYVLRGDGNLFRYGERGYVDHIDRFVLSVSVDAASRPQIEYTPIGLKWHGMGREGGVLGQPVGQTQSGTHNGSAFQWQDFQGGVIYWSAASGAHAILGSPTSANTFWGRFAASDYERGLGLPTGEVGHHAGMRWQTFERGVLYSAGTGPVHAVTGLGRVVGQAFITSDNGLAVRHERGTSYFTPWAGVRILNGPIWVRYRDGGAEGSSLGLPLSAGMTSVLPDVFVQSFQYGAIFWSESTGAQIVDAVNRDRILNTIQEFTTTLDGARHALNALSAADQQALRNAMPAPAVGIGSNLTGGLVTVREFWNREIGGRLENYLSSAFQTVREVTIGLPAEVATEISNFADRLAATGPLFRNGQLDQALGRVLVSVAELARDLVGVVAQTVVNAMVDHYAGMYGGVVLSQALTEQEIDFAHSIFPGINLQGVRIVESHLGYNGMVAGRVIYAGTRNLGDVRARALFAYELTHVYQDTQTGFIRGTPFATREALNRLFDRPFGNYDPYRVDVTGTTAWDSLKVEQQAVAVQTWVQYKGWGTWDTRLYGDISHLQALLQRAGLFRGNPGGWSW